MKRLWLASVALWALTGAEIAAAADAPPEVIYPAGYPGGAPLVAPVVAPRFTFTGFYAGGTIGGAAGRSKYAETPSGSFTTIVPSTPYSTVPPAGTPVAAALSNIASVGTSSTAPRGVIGGVEAGYNWQVGHFVLGFESDFSGWDLSSSAGVVGTGYPAVALQPQSAGNPCPNSATAKFPRCPAAVPGTSFTSTTSANSSWLFTARPRLGFANGNQLLYVTGGLAVSNFSFAQSIVLTGYGQPPGTGPTLAGAASVTQVGWTAGFGIEYALSWNWLIKAEYLYVGFPNQSASQVIAGAPASSGTLTDRLSGSVARAGFDYRF